MRLIDAEKCPCKNCGISYCYENCNKYYEWLNGCAYDVEKVVLALECEKTIWCGTKITTTDTMNIDDAIEIVRKGGVD